MPTHPPPPAQVCTGSVPSAAWACPTLTSVQLKRTVNQDGFCPGRIAACTSLRQLQIDECVLPGGTFPAVLCPALQHLTSLEIVNSGMTRGLPPAFSHLR